jgi:hypothetical protein
MYFAPLMHIGHGLILFICSMTMAAYRRLSGTLWLSNDLLVSSNKFSAKETLQVRQWR